MNPLEHVVYKLRTATVHEYPFPHFFVQDVFPQDFYGELLASLPTADTYAPLPGGYNARTATNDLPDLIKQFDNSYFASQVLNCFNRHFYERFPSHDRPKFSQELRFIRDGEGYSIGPHTDAPRKVVSLLFYLPSNYEDAEFGTGIYVPTDHNRTCEGGPHYKFDGFEEVYRAPFFPNSCFGFWKTANSWHAVEKISRKIQRDVLLFNIYAEK